MERSRSDSRRVESPAAEELSQLCRRFVGTGGSRRDYHPRRSSLEENSRMTMATTATTAALILAGDIGGTHSRLAILREDSGRLRLLQEKTYLSREHANLDGI